MFKCFIVVVAAMVLLAGPSRAEPLNPQAFTAAFAKAAAAAMPDAKVTVTGELSTDTRSAKGETTTSDLHNAYRVYLGQPQDLETIIANYVRILVDAVRVGDNPGLDRSRIVPVLKPTAWLEGIRKDRQAQGIVDAPEPLTEAYNSELIIAYAEDRPSSIRYLTTRDDVGGDRVSRGNYGLMQIRLGTARAMGFTGSAAELLDPQVNMTYAVRYLAGAYRAAGGNENRAVALYASGYYYQAKAQGFSPYAAEASSGFGVYSPGAFQMAENVGDAAPVYRARHYRHHPV